MAGANIQVDVVGVDEVSRALRRLADMGASLNEVLGDIGEDLLNSHQERFRSNTCGLETNCLSRTTCEEYSRSRRSRQVTMRTE